MLFYTIAVVTVWCALMGVGAYIEEKYFRG